MVSLAWHLVTFAWPQRCIWRVGRRKETSVEGYNYGLTIHIGPISWLITGQQSGQWVMLNEVVTCHLFLNFSFTQAAPFNGSLMEPKFKCAVCPLPNRIPFDSVRDEIIKWQHSCHSSSSFRNWHHVTTLCLSLCWSTLRLPQSIFSLLAASPEWKWKQTKYSN